MKNLSKAAQSLWAKKSNDGSLLWLPLAMHMADSAAIAQKLWNRWLPEGVQRGICAGIMEEDLAKQFVIFLAAAHDLGKATPVFQAKPARPLCLEMDERIAENLALAGMPIKHYIAFKRASNTPHALATQVLLEQAGCNRNASVILGAHHGKPPSSSNLTSCGVDAYSFNYHLEDEGKAVWTAVQQELIDYAAGIAGFSSMAEIPSPNMAAQVLISGLVIMTDWIASNEVFFPYIRLEDSMESLDIKARAKIAWEQFGLSFPWEAGNTWMRTDLYCQRFKFERPKKIQTAVAETVKSIHSPGIFVLEAPMGAGKTEAALVAAEAFANISKRSGVFFALPTQATSDGIFPRMLKWVKSLESNCEHSIMLAHGKAQFNEEYEELRMLEGSKHISVDCDSGIIVHDWFEGKKKSLLADFVVGTIDQLLLAALKQKHVMLRHLGLGNKVVIIDECHAYDAYMSRYLDMALRWLGTYGVPVIILSATLPAQKRQAVINAYLNEDLKTKQLDPLRRSIQTSAQQPEWMTSRSYPLITYTDGGTVKQTTVAIDQGETRKVLILPLAEGALADKLEDLLSSGGCAGVIVNTVKRAQELARMLRGHFGQEKVQLLHSRFLAPDRAEKEREILMELGKPGEGNQRPEKRIFVGTQVLEQSLDIDFDVLVTDLCPMDLLLQRIGRLHRHERLRPEKLNHARCLVMGIDCKDFEAGSKNIYGEYLLMRTKELLPRQLVLPQDIPNLVQDVYDEAVPLAVQPPGYFEAKKKWDKLIKDKEKRAGDFRICPPWPELTMNISGWLDKDVSDHEGEAAVRDSDESIEVLLIQEIEGKLFLLGAVNGSELPQNGIPDRELAKILARQRIRLPNILCGPWVIDKTIAELERLNGERLLAWQESPWLKGELFLILDENSSAHLCDYILTYDKNDGLLNEKEVETDA